MNRYQSTGPLARTSPGSAASVGRTCPAPCANARFASPDAVEVAANVLTRFSPVVISADLIIAVVQLGCRCFSRAASPATCGLAWDVPLTRLNRNPGDRRLDGE